MCPARAGACPSVAWPTARMISSPSLREAERLVVEGDVTFGAGVTVRGSVVLREPAPTRIEPGTVLESRT